MKTKIFAITLIAAILAVSFVLAADFTASPTNLKYNEPTTKLPLTLNSLTDTTVYNLVKPSIFQDNNVVIDFTFSTGGQFTASGTTQSIDVSAVVDYDEISVGKTYSGDITVTEDGVPTNTLSIPVSFTGSFCKAGEVGNNLEITDVKIDNDDGDDEEWSPLDEIKIEVEVTNNGDEKIKDVFVEIGLFNSEGKNVIKDMEDLDDEEIDLGSIKDDDEDTATFTFTIPADFESETYKLVVKAYSDDLGEASECVSKSSDLDNDFYQTIDGERETDEDKHIIFDNIIVSPTPAQCKERVQITGEVINIGDEDYEDQVKVTLFSNELGLNIEEIVREDFDEGDSELVEFEFDVPAGIDEKLYILEFRTFYDFDEDDNTYDLVSEDRFTTQLRVAGGCKVVSKSAQITADLDDETPEAIAGKQVIINAKVKNSGDVETTYTMSINGNSGWSSLVSLDPQVFTLQGGETKDVSIVLRIDDDANGDNEFTIKAAYDTLSTEQKVVLSVSDTSKQSQELTPVVAHLKSNWFIYLIILVNIVLIIAIILVIRSMVAPRPM
jgi:hypothetical protein